MLYIKHKCNSHRNENMSIIMDEFGVEGYGLYWIIVEIIADQMRGDKIEKTWVEYPYSKWKRLTGVSRQKLTKFCEFLAENENFSGNFEIFSIKKGQKTLTVNCPKILEIKDEYTRKLSKMSG